MYFQKFTGGLGMTFNGWKYLKTNHIIVNNGSKWLEMIVKS